MEDLRVPSVLLHVDTCDHSHCEQRRSVDRAVTSERDTSIDLCFLLAILKLVHAPRQVVGQQNEHLRSKLTRTLTLVSMMFLLLYFPHAIIETLLIFVVPYYRDRCDVRSLLTIRILKRLCELLNIAALGINFFLYILGVNHYRSAAIQMLRLHHFQLFHRYLTVEHRNSLGSLGSHLNPQQRRNTQTDCSSMRLLKVTSNDGPTSTNGSSSSAGPLKRLSA